MKKFLKSFRFAFNGIRYAFSTQLNFKIHFFAALVAVVLGFYFELQQGEWLWICLAIGMMLIVELLNTAVEVLVDKISPGYDVQAGIIKDVSAAAVLMTAFLAVLIGLFIFIPKIF